MAQAIISAVAALLGALVGGTATVVGGWWQHRRQVAADQHKQVRACEKEMAVECDRLLVEIDSTIPKLREEILRGDLEEQQRPRDCIISAKRQIRVNALFFPGEIRARIELLLEILDETQRMTIEHYHSESRIIQNSCIHGREVLAALIRYEDLPPLPDDIIEYGEALATIGRELEVEFSDVTSELDHARREFLDNHPGAKALIEGEHKRIQD